MTAQTFDWSKEINEMVTKSLVTTFGLDFLLFEDKKGGDIDTIHNVRQGIWATKKEKKNYEQREEYDSRAYHQDENYIQKGRNDKTLQQDGKLKDHYRKDKNFGQGDNRDLDHVIAAHEIHNDAGRILAGLDGVELANQDSNLSSTASGINRTKKQHSVDKFLENLPQTIKNREAELGKLGQQLKDMPQNTPQQKHEYQQVQDKIRKKQKSLDELQQVNANGMQKVDKKARTEYEKQIYTYYQSTKFFKSSLNAAGTAGVKMGVRESLGLVLAEIWFEIKEVVPAIYAKYKQIEFKILDFLSDLKETVLNVIERVKVRFKDILKNFFSSGISGFFSSLTTTIMNIFLTTTKFWGKIIRETWLNLVNIVKLAFFNPENLSTGELTKATFKILSASIGLIVGMIVKENLVILQAMPFGDEIAIFLSGFSSGIVILGLNYFIEQSEIMQKVWTYLDKIKSKYEKTVDHFKEINAELDRYVLELTQLGFGFNITELSQFAYQLEAVNSELECNILLKQEVEKQGIVLPFEIGNQESTINWLLELSQK
ncbi:DNA repair protein [Acinetobacter haemolyticus]|uniref:DNA repair protein n=2 Tax=Acinetobacter haemolyticus TaxID=29430 RepID=UPI001331E6F6|nr:DNA repair protein [Acinetobacter haemolyticus]NAR49378.1 DNA repair protein [Acinetobacter haemolyticus]NAR56479.1 DNA repair protein [Acinetobacter haemolyticus]NAR79310.1 DNA repair protein [Acinetobacter haemolyticus]NAR89071.1 DNA repair protein [Acinetobacter haemolyticus]NAR96816.1 DNA repair protein [Acinetobacter haemolyticus]